MILNALDEILFWEDIPLLKEFVSERYKQYYPHDFKGYMREKEMFLSKMIPTKEDFIRRMEQYLASGGAVWVAGRSEQIDEMREEDIRKAILIRTTPEHGRKRAETVEKIVEKAPDFWDYYANSALYAEENQILELTIGPGLGTAAIMRKMKAEDSYVGVDIDFVCAKNADALADYYDVKGVGMAASLWQLPFDTELFTAVTCNYGLEECRELPTILREAAQVLKPHGRFVLHCLKREKSLWYSYFQKYGFSPEETMHWLTRLRLYADADNVVEMTKPYGFSLFERYDDEYKGSILVLEKTD